ncbi:hypothetical protein H0O72_03280 [Escherichia coli]|uniref:hypothetical protein n=1 Tax=Escherichia coli TaxID=562 RepID=UPI0015D79C6F|nr:hypothetical protein [Escherichia coli]NZD12642.1 hypothetical protein [Escherichia coli]
MSTITREWLQQAINDYESVRDELPFGLDDYQGNILAALRIALASLEAEPIGFRCRRNDNLGDWSYVYHREPDDFERKHLVIEGIYAAPPAPVSVPAAMEIDDDFDSAFEHGKAVGWNAYRAAMLQAEPVSNSDELPLDYLQGHKDGLEWAAQLAEANHPQTGDWLYDDQIELARAIRKGPDMPTVQGGNSPVIPDGWVMVPVELTPDMRAAWDSAPYTDDDDNDMQAAYRAMIAAAPQWKVK